MKRVLIYIAIAASGICQAQTTVREQEQEKPLLTVSDAIKIALENNFDIRISKNDLKIDQTNVSWGNAGALPQLNANLVDNNGLQNSTQVRSDGTRTELNNAKNNSLQYGVSLGWTVFDGLGMFARYDRLQELEKLGQAELQGMILDRISDVVNRYYDLVQQQQVLASLDTTLVISKQRVELAHNRYTIGKASKLEVLNAQVDLNTDQTNLLRQKETFASAKIQLNQVLARDTKIDFKVGDEFLTDRTLLLPALEETALRQNPQLQATIISKQVAEFDLKVIKAQRYPVVGVSTGYNFAETQSSLGFTTSTSAKGLTYGFTASVPIFNGFNQNRNEKVAKIAIENAKLAAEQQNQAVIAQLGTAYQTYLTNISLIDLEAKNEEIAKENLSITMDKYRIGTIPTIEYRTAQLNFLNAQVRHSVARYNAKVSEVALRELAGNLSF
ncbi:TolC family protein [Flavobacterium silvaticum]|uniref:TolC family protein n=1 Tax=Flavobacterium silvaticum TaxID=1852020 RepID=A0A972FUN9_9FLAO|nr:TolC family protein [Flavobacterium silvaticum]NMH28868.1 TolC family protein [Flavobacterium silvaticum]